MFGKNTKLGYFGSDLINTFINSSATSTTSRIIRSTNITSEIIIFALFFSIIIGIIFWVIPAYRASKLKPIDVLKYE